MDESRAKTKAWTVKDIVKDGDNWVRYQHAYAGQVSAHQVAEVEKMLGCSDPAPGFATYICLKCGETVRVCFSCKSRVCSRCGKVYADEWAQQLTGRMFNVTHRHITCTLPAELWPIFEAEPVWRKVLFGAANRTLRKVLKAEPGSVMVLHLYGKDLKVNYHLHVLVTEGGLNEAGEWESQPFLNYAALRKIWQYECLTALRIVMPKRAETAKLIDRLFRTYQNGFYVHAEPRVAEAHGIARYIGRYIRHPAIADARILAYDGTTVTFFYEGHEAVRHEQTWPVLAFIHGVVRHIPPKQFKMVRYFGLYAPRKAAQVQVILRHIGQMVGRVVRRLSWRTRIQCDFDHDPLRCPRCGATDMALYALTVWSGGQLKTIGGLKWLFKRGILRQTDVAPPPKPDPLSIPSVQQLPLGLEVAP
ncbi:MAG: IS91 family transposase [Aggregatilineales bacterium]